MANTSIESEILSRTTKVCSELYKPLFYNLQDSEERAALEGLLNRNRGLMVHDSLFAQLEELIEIRTPSEVLSEKEMTARIQAQLGGIEATSYGRWVYFPWTSTLCHIVDEPEFREIRGSRNRDKITKDEQKELRSKRIGIVGLSVGNVIAMTMALEGIGGSFRLADFDHVALSNTNRMFCGVAEIGAHKARYCARKMFEIDPYLEIEVFDKGLVEDCSQEFFGVEFPLDLVIEECDSLPIKVRVRELARERKMPVLMETNDRGVVDIERFDLEPDRPLFHGLLEGTTSSELAVASRAEQLPLIFKLMGGKEKLSKRSADSLAQIGTNLRSWPQLGSDTVLGGAVVTSTARRILLRELQKSGRFYVDLGALIG